KATDNGDGSGPGQSLTSAQSFVLKVLSANEPPNLAFIGDKVALIGKLLTFTLRASDLDQDNLSFSASGLPAGATLNPGPSYGTSVFNWTPGAGDSGTRTVTFKVADDGNGKPAQTLSDTETVRFVVRTSNSAPILQPVGDQTITELETLTLKLR